MSPIKRGEGAKVEVSADGRAAEEIFFIKKRIQYRDIWCTVN
jgi:hypothetical protein